MACRNLSSPSAQDQLAAETLCWKVASSTAGSRGGIPQCSSCNTVVRNRPQVRGHSSAAGLARKVDRLHNGEQQAHSHTAHPMSRAMFGSSEGSIRLNDKKPPTCRSAQRLAGMVHA